MLLDPIRVRWRIRRDNQALCAQIARVRAYLDARPTPKASDGPVLPFNASTRIHRLSLNGAFSLLTGWSLRAAGVPVRQVVCRAAMQQCTLGAQRLNLEAPPPCARCVAFSDILFTGLPVCNLTPHPAELAVTRLLDSMSLEELLAWESDGVAFGSLVLPAVRWVLRRHDLQDSEPVRRLVRQFLRSAVGLHMRFQELIEQETPRALVVFNGIMYPEAVVRLCARRAGIPVITHEVGLQSFSTFFSAREATFREVWIDPRGGMSAEESERLDEYLRGRFTGRFRMAGIDFWPDMQPLPESLEARLAGFRQTVTIFSNVVFDTSQVHANTLFETMFEWLEDLRLAIPRHPDTLFVIRAHPDEDRPGKESQQSVAGWYASSGLRQAPNVVFLGPSDYVSSYELIRRSKLVLVYNSSVGLEASIAGVPVLCAGRARYTQIPTVYFPATRAEYGLALEALLGASVLLAPDTFSANARR
ncbi:MAG: hypothetical protein NTU91_12290, partial [Chloroflexi bacterium]|nr:hypothetical protein [Chloroflexota bacterium]